MILGGAILLLALAGCGEDVAPVACTVHADCGPDGRCDADGRCILENGNGAGNGENGGDPPGNGEKGGNGENGDPPPACVPDHDLEIRRDQVRLEAGLAATYRVATEVEVDTAGVLRDDGSRLWDLSSALPGDADLTVRLEAVDERWYEGVFDDVTYATPLAHDDAHLGVFRAEDTALRLVGVVSPDGGALRTELTYSPAVRVLAFPLNLGDRFETDAEVSGLFHGVWSQYAESWRAHVDAHGELLTPLGAFPVLRVRVEIARTVGFSTTTRRSYLFVAECFGTVASIASRDDEPNTEFTHAAEVRRIAP